MTGNHQPLKSISNLPHELKPIRHAKISKTIIISKSANSKNITQINPLKQSENRIEELTGEIDSLLTEGT